MRCLIALLALFLLTEPSRAQAQTCSATVSSVDFGSPDLLSATPTDALASVTVTCTNMTLLSVVKVCPSIGAGSGGSSGASRLLKSGSRTLSYQLFQDAARTQGWGSLDNTQLGTVPAMILSGAILGAGTGTATRTLYARLFADPTAYTGAYTSSFAGSQTMFSYSNLLLGATTSCTGFVGNSVLRPEFQVSASPQPSCTIAATDLDFGVTGVLNAAINGQSALDIACTQGASWSLTLDGGGAGNTAARRMTSPAGDAVSYNLYRDAGRSALWGTTADTQATGVGVGVLQKLQVYGRVPAQSTPKPGAYADRVIATIRF